MKTATLPLNGEEATGRKSPRGLDKELQTMAQIDRIMAGLEPRQAEMVYVWFTTKYRPELD